MLVFQDNLPSKWSFTARDPCNGCSVEPQFWDALHTVDGRNPADQLIGIYSSSQYLQYIQGFIHVRWCRISCINSVRQKQQKGLQNSFKATNKGPSKKAGMPWFFLRFPDWCNQNTLSTPLGFWLVGLWSTIKTSTTTQLTLFHPLVSSWRSKNNPTDLR